MKHYHAATRIRPINSLLVFGALMVPMLTPLPSGAVTAAVTAPASSAEQVFQQLRADSWINRSVTLAELGFKGPVVLASTDTLREFYLPVPANVAVADAALQLDANYLRADGGRTSMIVSLDNYPVSARPFTLDHGDAGIALGVDGSPRASGFVRLGVNWTSVLPRETLCADSRAPGNILRIEPTTRLSYRYDGATVADLNTAWGALPATTTILVAGGTLAASSYDTAWRLGVALERAGKRSVIVTLPAVGENVNLTGVTVPAALRDMPAFAALAEGGMHRLANAAEVGALMALGQGSKFHADMIVDDEALRTQMHAAFDAAAVQISGTAPAAGTAFSAWRNRIEPATEQSVGREVRLVNAFGRPAILVSAGAGAKAASLFGDFWHAIGVAPAVSLKTVEVPRSDDSVLTLKMLGGMPASFDVLGHAEWTASFDLASVAGDGRLPETLMLDVAAAPGASRAAPVASVFLNDVLLGASHLTADGKRERIVARIPRNALSARNVIKVSFVRQLSSDNCKETPEPYPVAVLDSSHMILKKAEPEDNFIGMLSRFASSATLIVPTGYLADPTLTLPRVIRMASSTGLSTSTTKLDVAEPGKEVKPAGNFLAMDIDFKNDKNLVKVDGTQLVLTDHGNRPLLDMNGLNGVGVLQVGAVGGQAGILYRTVGKGNPSYDKPFRLSRGNVAAIGPNGLLTEIDTENASGRDVNKDDDSFALRNTLWWILPIIGIILFIVLLVFASRMRRRRAAAKLPR